MVHETPAAWNYESITLKQWKPTKEAEDKFLQRAQSSVVRWVSRQPMRTSSGYKRIVEQCQAHGKQSCRAKPSHKHKNDDPTTSAQQVSLSLPCPSPEPMLLTAGKRIRWRPWLYRHPPGSPPVHRLTGRLPRWRPRPTTMSPPGRTVPRRRTATVIPKSARIVKNNTTLRVAAAPTHGRKCCRPDADVCETESTSPAYQSCELYNAKIDETQDIEIRLQLLSHA